MASGQWMTSLCGFCLCLDAVSLGTPKLSGSNRNRHRSRGKMNHRSCVISGYMYRPCEHRKDQLTLQLVGALHAAPDPRAGSHSTSMTQELVHATSLALCASSTGATHTPIRRPHQRECTLEIGL